MELFYREFGVGYPLVVLHGLYGSSDNWTGIARKLSDKFRVILPDQRNHGRSPHSKDHTYDSMSNDLHKLVDKLGLKKFLLAGHSMGGKAAVWFSMKWPERIAGLIIVDMSPFKTDTEGNQHYEFHKSVLEVMNSANLESMQTREDTEDIFNGVVNSKSIRNFLLKNIGRNRNGNFEWKLNPGFLKKNLSNILDGIKKPEEGDTPVTGFPVKFLKAEYSDYLREEEYSFIYKLFPAADIELVEGTSHWLHAERPDIFIRAIRDFAES